ncbi:hypothetical protein BKA70DRAFT_1202793 [Coprinopsis sp. MPI-PUGE-AT-0042]|nr:hypothetical protein BKA70DRAFT_1202793 [Coprinopsis sp. MPI-PUGE-AT-0042]
MTHPLSYLPLSTSAIAVEDQAHGGIVHTFLQKSTWIWPEEGGFPAPMVPGDVQRAFRKTLNIPRSKRVKQTTVVITADNYFQLYVNGVLLHRADSNHNWGAPIVFTVPVSGDKVVYAVRAINRYADIGLWQPSPAGLRVAVQVEYTDGTKGPVSYTGQDHGWLSERLFPEGWHEPNFDDRRWKPAMVMPNAFAIGPVWGALERPYQSFTAETLPTIHLDTSSPSELTCSPGDGHVLAPIGGLNRSIHGGRATFVGGFFLGAVVAGIVLSLALARRRRRRLGKDELPA